MNSIQITLALKLIFLTFVVIGITAFVDDPTQEGYVVSKHFTPAHWVFTGKTSIYVSDSWAVTIEKCDESTPPKCQSGYYHVSQETYNQTKNGDYMEFSDPGRVGDTILRFILFVLGIGCLAVVILFSSMLIEDGTTYITSGFDTFMNFFMIIIVLFLLVVGEGMIFFAVKGPTGFI